MNLKRNFIILLLVLVASSFVSSLMIEDTGYVRISYLNYLIETSLWFASFVLLLFLLFLYLVGFLFRRVVGTGSVFSSWARNRSHRISQKRTQQGMVQLAEGDWRKAHRFLTYAAKHSEAPLVNYLTAAQAASAMGNVDEAESLLNKARESSPEEELAIGLTQARLLLDAAQFERALEGLTRLRKSVPGHAQVLRLLMRACEGTGDWTQLTQIAADARQRNVIPDEEIRTFERLAWVGLLEQTGDEIKRLEGASRSLAPLEAVWNRLPSNLSHNSRVIEAYAGQLIRFGELNRSEEVLRKALNQNWDAGLLSMYGRTAAKSVTDQLETVKQWLGKHPENAHLLLAAGRISLRMHDWEAARGYFEQSLLIEKLPETMGELCRLYLHSGNQEKGNQFLAGGVVEPLRLPDLPMPGASK